MALNLQQTDDGVAITVKVVPGSSRTALVGELDGMLKVKLAAPPEKGKANKELISFLAAKLGVKKNAVTITSGRTNPVKTLQITGTTPQTLQERLL